jgi:hypothetical protein
MTDAQRCRLPSLLVQVERVEWVPDPQCFQIITHIFWELISDEGVEGRGRFRVFSD